MPWALDIFSGAEGQNRTADTGIFSPLLYRLSYLGTRRDDHLTKTVLVGKDFFVRDGVKNSDCCRKGAAWVYTGLSN